MFSVRLDSPDLTFTASHRIRFLDGTSERLHEHRFRVVAEISGPLNAVGYVVDFLLFSETLRKILRYLDGKILLPKDEREEHEAQNSETVLRLPIPGTTAEFLAADIADRLSRSLRQRNGFAFPQEDYEIAIALEEAHGMWAGFKKQNTEYR